MNFFFRSDKDHRVFVDNLRMELSMDLPGVNSHLLLAPEIRIPDLKTGNVPENPKESAVLIILYPLLSRLHTVVILRNEYDGAHSGQISLPGGKREKSDIDFQQTALREAKEEIGINPDTMEIVGQLSRFYVRPSNFVVFPFIAFIPKRPVFQPDRTEVQRVIEIDIFKEINYQNVVNKTIYFKNNLKVHAPGFPVGGEFMWGATAMIFSELFQVLTNVTERLVNNPAN